MMTSLVDRCLRRHINRHQPSRSRPRKLHQNRLRRRMSLSKVVGCRERLGLRRAI
jgi:hypothetical protein